MSTIGRELPRRRKLLIGKDAPGPAHANTSIKDPMRCGPDASVEGPARTKLRDDGREARHAVSEANNDKPRRAKHLADKLEPGWRRSGANVGASARGAPQRENDVPEKLWRESGAPSCMPLRADVDGPGREGLRKDGEEPNCTTSSAGRVEIEQRHRPMAGGMGPIKLACSGSEKSE